MTYAVYFEWSDGFRDSFNCKGKADLELNLKEIANNPDQKLLRVNKVKANGEHVPYRVK